MKNEIFIDGLTGLFLDYLVQLLLDLAYGEKSELSDFISPVYDPEKLIEHQFKDAVESFITNYEYNIRVVNISFGNSDEIWHKDYTRQLPLAALIDELAYIYPHIVFIVSAGNMHPLNIYKTIEEISDNYPEYLYENKKFKIINPATSALALTVGSIAGKEKTEKQKYGEEKIKAVVAPSNHPSPFSRTGYGINGMVKPELVDYGGNLIFYNNYGQITEDMGGKIALLNNKTTENIIKFDYGTSYTAPKVANLAGRIANRYPHRSANFIKNLLLTGSEHPFPPDKKFYNTKDNDKALKKHLSVCGYGKVDYERSINSFDNRVVLYDEGQIGLNQIKVYTLNLPQIFFTEKGKKKITVILTFNPETRSSRGDSYIGNSMEFHLFHSVNPQRIVEKYGIISDQNGRKSVPEELKKFEIKFQPLATLRKVGCHQKGWKEYKREPKTTPTPPITLALLNFDKWIKDKNRIQDFCLSVIFEHEKEIKLYNAIRTSIQIRAKVK